jgi:hypothetical protein
MARPSLTRAELVDGASMHPISSIYQQQLSGSLPAGQVDKVDLLIPVTLVSPAVNSTEI